MGHGQNEEDVILPSHKAKIWLAVHGQLDTSGAKLDSVCSFNDGVTRDFP